MSRTARKLLAHAVKWAIQRFTLDRQALDAIVELWAAEAVERQEVTPELVPVITPYVEDAIRDNLDDFYDDLEWEIEITINDEVDHATNG